MDVVTNPTLDKFIRESTARSAYVEEPGFTELYVRRTRRYINGEFYQNVLDIGRIEAAVQGQGAFKALIARLQRDYPTLSIYVESVLTERFREGLVRLGFQDVGPHPLTPCFFLPAAADEVPPCAA